METDTIRTGFSSIDMVTEGLKSSEVMVIAGRGRTGKTTFALSIAKNVAVDKKIPCAFFSMETTCVKLTNQLIANICNIDGDKIINGQINHDEWEKLDKHISSLTGSPLYIDDKPSLTIDELKDSVRKLSSEHGVRLFIIDSLQLIDCYKHYCSDELFVCMNSLRKLADELKVTMIITSILGVGTEEKHHYPKMSDHHEFMVFNDFADYSIFLYRPDHYHVQTIEKKAEGVNFGCLKIAKRGFEQTGENILLYINERNAFAQLNHSFDYKTQRMVTAVDEICKPNKTILLLQVNGIMKNLADILNVYFPHDTIIVPQINCNPDKDLPYIRLLCQEHHPDLIIGVELGAMYAIMLHDYHRICINPCSWYVTRSFTNITALENLDKHLFDNLSEESRRKCWGFFIRSKIPYNCLRESFISQFFPNVIDIPKNDRDDRAILQDVILPFAKMLLDEERTDEWGVTYSSYGRKLKKIDPLLFNCEEYTIPEGVEEMLDSFWLTEAKLKRIQLPSTLRKMDVNTFIRCEIEELELPEGITEVPEFMCECCRKLKKLVLPSTIKEIKGGAFNCCTQLEEINLPGNIEFIEDGCFRYTESLKYVKLPSQIEYISSELFYCSGIETIDIHEQITEIGHWAFWGCARLKRLIIPKTVKCIGYGIVSAHEGFEGVECHAKGFHVENDALIDDERQELLCCWTHQKNYIIPGGIKRIADFSGNPYVETITVKQFVELTTSDTFASDTNLQKIEFLSGVTGICGGTYYNCPKLENK